MEKTTNWEYLEVKLVQKIKCLIYNIFAIKRKTLEQKIYFKGETHNEKSLHNKQ